jgi:hypothetical protein
VHPEVPVTGPEPYLASDYVALFLALFEHSSDAVWITRADDGLLYEANPASFRCSG